MNVSLPLPPDVSGPEVEVSGQSCVTAYDAKDGTVVVAGAKSDPGDCTVTATAAPGAPSYVSVVPFQYFGRDCGWRATGEASPFTSAASFGPGFVVIELELPLPDDLAGRVVDVTSDSCGASYWPAYNVVATTYSAGAPTCTIVASLDDGTALAAVGTFPMCLATNSAGTCTDYFANSSSNPYTPFAPLAGGAPACSR
jgi:hypothetical protein